MLGTEGTPILLMQTINTSNNATSDAGLRSGGAWWARPWIGEICPDAVYGSQWLPWGNLRAESGSAADRFHHVLRDDVPASQLPFGTPGLEASRGDLGAAGCTAFFNAGTSESTVCQDDDGDAGLLVEAGMELGRYYGYPHFTV